MSLFQSTPSVGRATSEQIDTCEYLNYFNPRPPWGGRPIKKIQKPKKQAFQSTPSVGRATGGTYAENNINKKISIHALRGEGDPDSAKIFSKACDFNPRPPWGGRRKLPITYSQSIKFQSTPSVGRATEKYRKIKRQNSTHRS